MDLFMWSWHVYTEWIGGFINFATIVTNVAETKMCLNMILNVLSCFSNFTTSQTFPHSTLNISYKSIYLFLERISIL